MLSPAMAPTSAVSPRIQRFGWPLCTEYAAGPRSAVSLGTTSRSRPRRRKPAGRGRSTTGQRHGAAWSMNSMQAVLLDDWNGQLSRNGTRDDRGQNHERSAANRRDPIAVSVPRAGRPKSATFRPADVPAAALRAPPRIRRAGTEASVPPGRRPRNLLITRSSDDAQDDRADDRMAAPSGNRGFSQTTDQQTGDPHP